jgi:hypothetical protein
MNGPHLRRRQPWFVSKDHDAAPVRVAIKPPRCISQVATDHDIVPLVHHTSLMTGSRSPEAEPHLAATSAQAQERPWNLAHVHRPR